MAGTTWTSCGRRMGMCCSTNQSFSSFNISSPFENISSKTDNNTHLVITGHQSNQIQLSRNICIYFIEHSIFSTRLLAFLLEIFFNSHRNRSGLNCWPYLTSSGLEMREKQILTKLYELVQTFSAATINWSDLESGILTLCLPDHDFGSWCKQADKQSRGPTSVLPDNS